MTFFGGVENWRNPELLADAEPEVPLGADADAVEGADGTGAEATLAHAATATDTHDDHHAHDEHHGLTPDHTPVESPTTMLVPLIVLAGLALIGGLLNLPFSHRLHFLKEWIHPVIVGEHELPEAAVLWVLAIVAITGAVVGIFFAYRVYQQRKVDPAKLEKPVLAHAWYIDDTYAAVVGGPGEAAFQGAADFDAGIVDGAVLGVAHGTDAAAKVLKPVQSGIVRTYAAGVAIGTVALAVFVIMRMGF